MVDVRELSPITVVTPELIKPLFNDIGGPILESGAGQQLGDTISHAADYYFRRYIENCRDGDGSYNVTMGDLNSLVLVFYDAYLAGLAHIKEPEPS